MIIPQRLLSRPKDLTYKELHTILNQLGYILIRSKGTNMIYEKNRKILSFHIPHRYKTFQAYQITKIIHTLERNEK